LGIKTVKKRKIGNRKKPLPRDPSRKVKVESVAPVQKEKKQKKEKKVKSNLKQIIAKKLPIPFKATADHKLTTQEKRANKAVEKKRKIFLLREKSKAYESHLPKIPYPEHLKLASSNARKLYYKRRLFTAREELKRKNVKIHAIKNARKYEAEYRRNARALIRNRRIARNTNTFFVEPEAKVVFVIRIRGINGVSPKVKKALQLLRLRQIHNGTFVKINGASLQILKLVEPYVTYGTPNLKSVRELIYKRGYGKINGQRIQLRQNVLIHDNLGRFGIHCVEDIIHEIFTCGPHFKEVNRFLWAFKLASPVGGFVKKRIHFVEGGDCGDREHYINRLIRRMN